MKANPSRLLLTLILITAGLTGTAAGDSHDPAVRSEPYLWKNVTIGAGGFIPGIVFSRVKKGLAYIRSDMGGFYRWEDQAQRWIPLNDAMTQSSYHGGESIAPDPVDPDVVYAAAGMYRWDSAAMLRSHDRGATWEVFPVDFKMGGNEAGRGVGERLAVDPNSTNVLLFGSRYSGLMLSVDRAEHWKQLASFPIKESTKSNNGKLPEHAGLSFVVFDAHSAVRGQKTKTIFVGSSEPGPDHLFRSDDAGQTWNAVTGGPGPDLLPLQAQIDDRGRLYITCSDAAGPNSATRGGVFMLDTHTGAWTDITPYRRPDGSGCGFCGLSLDRQHPGTLAVSTLDRWSPGDTVFRTVDDGKSWGDVAPKSIRDVSKTPFLTWGRKEASFGWWVAALAIDPFDSDHALYATGASVFATHDFSNVTRNQPSHWSVPVDGIEQTAVTTLCSPPTGAPLLSGIGDIVGFVHDDLDQSPPQGFYQPALGNSALVIDYAALQPNILVRTGDASEHSDSAAFSTDFGRTWQVISTPEAANGPVRTPHGSGHRLAPAISVSADGGIFILMHGTAWRTVDHGKSWLQVTGLPTNVRPIADRLNPRRFYAMDFRANQLLQSDDGGQTFSQRVSRGLPADVSVDQPNWAGASWPLQAAPGKAGDLWYFGRTGLFHSSDGGSDFTQVKSDVHVDALSFGKAPPGRDEPALFALGSVKELSAIWRSDDGGQNWLRLNDAQHEWGRRFRCISGDPRVFGRVYVGTDGRGILYGTPVQP
jgi:photosystem II stability/assembly factor-like uncharacterized protein